MEKGRITLIVSSSISIIAMALAFLWLLDSSVDWLEPVFVIVSLVLTIATSLFSSLKLKKKENKIFIIYSHDDKEKAQAITRELRKAEFNVLLDEDVVSIGDDIHSSLKGAMNDANSFVFLSSKSSNKSEWVFSELQHAIKSNKRLIPVIIDDSEPLKLIKGLKYADLREFNEKTALQFVSGLKEKPSVQTI